MRFAIVDDEPIILKQIPKLIKQFASDANIDTDCFQSAAEFLNRYSSQSYDALFLDIDMPEMSGFKLAEHLRRNNDDVPIIYITARDDLIIQAFRYKAIGFVRKQYLNKELPFALTSILSEINKENDMIEVTETRAAGGRTHRIEINQIMYIENVRNNVNIYLIGRREIIVRSSITYFMKHKGFEHFTMINSGTIVNLSLIEMTEDKVCFSDGIELYISRRKIKDVRTAYLNNMRKVLI